MLLKQTLPTVHAASMRSEIIRLLSDQKFHSGVELGCLLHVTRTAIWKQIRVLLSMGIAIEAINAKGYRLTHPVELLDEKIILRSMKKKTAVREIIVLDEIDSTNNFLMKRTRIHGVAVLAEYQSSGRGRFQRRWYSPYASGIYLSCGWNMLGSITGLPLALGVVIVKTLEKAGVPGVALKWPNDIIANNAKLGGVLVEIQGELHGKNRVVVGIGINLKFAKPSPLASTTCIDIASLTSAPPAKNVLLGKLIYAIFDLLNHYPEKTFSYYQAEWQRYDHYLGRPITLTQFGKKPLSGNVCGVDKEGALLLNINGQLKRFTTGETSAKQ